MALREILAHFGFSFDRAKLNEVRSAIDGVKAAAAKAGGSTGLGALVGGLQAAATGFLAGAAVRFTQEIAEQAAALQDLSDQTGLATDDLQAWTLAANLGGASAQDFTGGLRKLSKELATGVDESGQQSKLFRNLGIDTKNAAEDVRDLSDVLPEIADKFKDLKSGAEKSALAQQIFGKAGGKLVPLLSQGAAGVAALRKQFEELGGGFSKEAIANADEYDDALLKLQFSFFGLKSMLATSVFPALANVVGIITKASVGASKWLKETTLLGNGVKILAGLLTGKLLLALAPFLLPGLKFLAIFLAVDDLIAFLEGKDSVIGDILNAWFGEGTATVVRKWCNDAKTAIKEILIGTLDLLKIAVSDNADEIDKLGTHFLTNTNMIGDAVQAVIDKVMLLKDAFSIENLKEGANEFLDMITSPFDTDADKAQKRARKTKALSEKADAAIEANPFENRATGRDFGALGNAFDNIANGVGGYGPSAPVSLSSASSSAGVTNNISPISVQQTFAPGTGPEVRKIAKEAAQSGVAAGLAEYRAALQSLEQRAP